MASTRGNMSAVESSRAYAPDDLASPDTIVDPRSGPARPPRGGGAGEYQIRVGAELVMFQVVEDLVAVKESGAVRGLGGQHRLAELVRPRLDLGWSIELTAFARAGWLLGLPAHDRVRERADRAARIDHIDVRQVLVDSGGRHYIDSGQVVASLDAMNVADAIDVLESDGLSMLRRLPIGGHSLRRGTHVFLAKLPAERSTMEAIQSLQASGHYNYIEPDLLEHIDSRWRPSDPEYNLQWQWFNDGSYGGVVGADVGAERAWERTRGRGARIAVVDKGFDLAHPALARAVAWGGYFTGTADDVRFLPAAAAGYPPSRHGTACAGMAIARSGSGSGGCGIANEADFMPLACLTDHLGTQRTLAEALVYAALPLRSGSGEGASGADVICCSLGPNGAHWHLTSVLSDAIDTVIRDGRGGLGALLVWAASNANAPIESDKVACDPRVLAVARSTRMDLHDHAAFGRGLDLVAPGVDVYTTASGARPWRFGTACSLAAPIVAGVAGLVIARDPSLTRSELAGRLVSTCRKIGGGYDPTGWSARYGFGRVDANAAVP